MWGIASIVSSYTVAYLVIFLETPGSAVASDSSLHKQSVYCFEEVVLGELETCSEVKREASLLIILLTWAWIPALRDIPHKCWWRDY